VPQEKGSIERPHADKVVLFFLYAVCLVEGADLALLPSSFRALEVSLGLTPSRLAALGLAQAFTGAIAAPIWGSFADIGWSRKMLLVAGASAWGLLTLLLSFVSEFFTMLALRALNGVALAALMPISQSVIADISVASERGMLFGWASFSLNVGVVFGTVFATSLSNMRILGFAGWRVAFASVAAVSFVLAISMAIFMPDSQRTSSKGEIDVLRELNKIRTYWRIDTFKVILIQGAFGSIPWSALAFSTMYFQYVGLTDFGASTLSATFTIACAFGGLMGGFIGDRLARWSRYHGRPLTAQVSVFSGIPLVVLIYAVVPREADYFLLYLGLLFLLGLLASWCAAGVNRPILCEVVHGAGRASIIAWLVAIDGSIAAVMGGPLVALLSEHVFGYSSTRQQVSDMSEENRESNAKALSLAMICCSVVPWFLCLVCYSLLHWTYKADMLANDRSAGDTENKEPTQLLIAERG